jgi:hypothetical protein
VLSAAEDSDTIITPRPPAEGRSPAVPRRRLVGTLVVVSVAVAASVAACGGSTSSGVANLRSTTTAGSNGSGASSAGQSGVLYASCMREHGVTKFPDPDPVPGGRFEIPLSLNLKSNPQWLSAVHACQTDLPGGGPAAKAHVNVRNELSFASCMRSHGITDFPDPNLQGVIQIPGAINLNSPLFEATDTVCGGSKSGGGIPIAISPGSSGS